MPLSADVSPAPIVADPPLVAALRADLAAAGYGADAVRAAWGAEADDAIGAGVMAPALARLAGRDDPLAVLARTLFLGRATTASALDGALPRTGTDGMVTLGLVRRDAEAVVPTAVVRPQDFADEQGEGSWWVASDLDEVALGGVLPTGHVLGVGGASLTLAGLQVTRPAQRALDLGTGSGIQALRVRRVADAVVATDISERALQFAALNALLNDVDQIELRAGSLFEPVAGELFDRVVSNPPFVITPRAAGVPEYEYRDGGLTGDALAARVISGVGDVLTPGGSAQLLANWEYRTDADGLERVREWVTTASVPMDAWVVEREQLNPLGYAQLWARDGGAVPGSEEYNAMVTAWLDDFTQRGVTAIGFGYVLLRRREPGAPALERYERVTTPVSAALGPHLTASLDAWDRVAWLDDDALAEVALTVSSDVTEARFSDPGAEGPRVIQLLQGGGFARVIEVDSALAAVVGACDGDLAVGVLIDAVAQLLEVDAVALRADLLPRVRDLVFVGMLRLPE